MPSRLRNGTLISILAVALLLRALPAPMNWSTPGVFMDFDSFGYQTLAQNLAHGRGFSLSTTAPYEPALYRTPGLPLLLAVPFKFGLGVQHVLALQALLSTGTVVVLFLLLRRVFDLRTASVGCALLAIDPITISYTNFLLTEIYSQFLLTCAALFVAWFAQTNQTRHLVLASATVGLTILIHPAFLFLPLALLPLWLLHPFRERPLARVARIVCTLFVMYIPTGVWVLRNVYVANYYGVATVASVNMMKAKAGAVMAELNGTRHAAEAERMTRECELKIGPAGTAAERMRCWDDIGTRVLLSHPITYARIHVRGMVRELVGPGTDFLIRLIYGGDEVLDASGRLSDNRIDNTYSTPGRPHLKALVLLAIIAHGVFLCSFVAGLIVQAIRKQWRVSVALLVPLVYVLTITGGVEGFSRFRTTYVPFFLTFSAVALVALAEMRAWWPKPRTSSPAVRGA